MDKYFICLANSYKHGGRCVAGVEVLWDGEKSTVVREDNGAARWIRIAGLTFQPSELAKLSLIVVIADQLARIKTKSDKKKYFFNSTFQ